MSDQLSELNLKHVAAAGVLAAGALTGSTSHKHVELPQLPIEQHEAEMKRLTFKQHMAQQESKAKELASIITDKYGAVSNDTALEVARLALKHEKPTFPKAADILSVIGVESTFNPNAVSALKHDPAVGLMQIRPGVWGIKPGVLKGNIENQVKMGADILHTYYNKLKSKDGALQAYNIGMTNYMKSKGLNPRYVPKVNAEREMYESEERSVLSVMGQQPEEFHGDFWCEQKELTSLKGSSTSVNGK